MDPHKLADWHSERSEESASVFKLLTVEASLRWQESLRRLRGPQTKSASFLFKKQEVVPGKELEIFHELESRFFGLADHL